MTKSTLLSQINLHLDHCLTSRVYAIATRPTKDHMPYFDTNVHNTTRSYTDVFHKVKLGGLLPNKKKC